MTTIHSVIEATPVPASRARMSVVVCTLNGAGRLENCLAAINRQTCRQHLQVVVVDDGSSDESAATAAEHGAEVIRHSSNRGLGAARNSGIAASRAEIVAFLDDDCEPEPGWAEAILGAFDSSHRAAATLDSNKVIGVGGPVHPAVGSGYAAGYLVRNNPLVPLEIDLAARNGIAYRFGRYLMRVFNDTPTGARAVYSVVGANMAFRTEVIRAVGGFDERFSFGSEELELCLRLKDVYPESVIRFEPSAAVSHHFDARPSALLRRHRAYGIGVARLYRKRGDLAPTVYPLPIIITLLLVLSRKNPLLLIVIVALPQLLFGRGLREALRRNSLTPLADCYVRLLEEASSNIGFAIGGWRYRGVF